MDVKRLHVLHYRNISTPVGSVPGIQMEFRHVGLQPLAIVDNGQHIRFKRVYTGMGSGAYTYVHQKQIAQHNQSIR